jgi:PKHD-type hydroxylase
MITLPFLTTEDFKIIDPLIRKIKFIDGKKSANGAAKLAKTNEEADVNDRNYQEVVNYIYKKIFKDAYVSSYAHTRLITQPIINRASNGGAYGTHYDTTFMEFRDRQIRTDLSFTIFLKEPETYRGGELQIEYPNNKVNVKLDKGSICLYPSARWHQVLPVTSGERVCCVGWIESNIKSEQVREALWDLVLFSKHLTTLNAPQATILEFNKVSNYLIKSISQI